MTPKEKAKELVEKYAIWCWNETVCNYEVAKQCALIAVDEIIDLLPNINLIPPIQRRPDKFYLQYWVIVKQEIEKL